MLKTIWYRALFALILVLPAVLCQTVYPVFSEKFFEDMSESVYASLLRWREPAVGDQSKVVLVEVDKHTIDAYGWPIDRSYYVQLLDKLHAAGHPWVLSLLQFQSLEKQKSSDGSREMRMQKDKELVGAIKRYDRYIGTGLEVENGAELTPEQEDLLMPRVVLTKDGKWPEALPYLPINMAEDERFVEPQRAFGYATRFGVEPIIHCMPMYLTDAQHTGGFVIPSSLVWTAAFATGARFTTGSGGAGWPRIPGKHNLKSRMRVAYKHCLAQPGVLTRDFQKQRGIERLSLVGLLEKAAMPDFTGKVVMLARDDMRRFRGAGVATAEDDGTVEEQLLAARFLDGLITGATIHREDLKREPIFAWLPLAAAAGLAAASLVMSMPMLILLAGLTLVGTLSVSMVSLYDGQFLVPIQMLTSVATTAACLSVLYAYLRYYGIRRQVRFGNRLREGLSQCNTLLDVEALARKAASEEFESATLSFDDYDRELYEASSDANAALAYLEKSSKVVELGQFGERPHGTQMTRVGKPRGITRMPFRARGLEMRLAIESKLGRLGTIKIGLAYAPHEEAFISNLLDILRVEVGMHWHRIKLLVDQKLLDFKFLMEQTRGNILERFLTHVLVAKFTDNKTMEENLKTVLTPRATRAALMQADIRGYSKVSAKMPPLDMLKLVQGYFRNVVDAAQLVAQVKLIGDCIFLFIEEGVTGPGASPADLALELAAILVDETEKQNVMRVQEGIDSLYFGIAIHYGDVVVGNLSSDMCIDYTVIGPNVNLVARLEEMTKHPSIAAIAGTNGLIMSNAAKNALIKHRGIETITVDLETNGASVRSFGDVKEVQAMVSEKVRAVASDAIDAVRKAG